MQDGDFWVFGYGSLMWRPDFPFEEAVKARLAGFHRCLCIRSVVHRGSPARPGLVLGLDRGGSCVGVGFRVAGELRAPVLAYLHDRELVSAVYHEREVGLRLADGRRVRAIAYVADRAHAQYAGMLDPAQQAEQVRGAVGQSGRNEDYVANTLAHLAELGIRDATLERVARHAGCTPARLGAPGRPVRPPRGGRPARPALTKEW